MRSGKEEKKRQNVAYDIRTERSSEAARDGAPASKQGLQRLRCYGTGGFGRVLIWFWPSWVPRFCEELKGRTNNKAPNRRLSEWWSSVGSKTVTATRDSRR